MAVMNNQSYREWCRGIKDSDRSAYEEVFREMHDKLYRYAFSITTDRSSALDLVQETFLDLWEKRASLDPERSLKALLFRMVRNKAYNHQRNHRRREEILQNNPSRLPMGQPVLPDGMVSANHLDEKLQKWIGRLPNRQREALVLSRYEGMNHNEIAEVMEISPRTVNNHLVRALKTLRDQIRSYEPGLLGS